MRKIIIYVSFIIILFSASSAENVYGETRIYASGNMNFETGRLKEKLPYGYGFSYGFDFDLFDVTGSKLLWIPGVKLETGFIMYGKDSAGIGGIGILPGIFWRFGLFGNSSATLSCLAGVSLMSVKDGAESGTANVFSLKAGLGYEYYYKNMFIILQAGYSFFHDSSYPLKSVSVSAGFGRKI